MKVEIWSDVVCPWCYLGKRHFERALEAFDGRDDIDVVYRSFELNPDAPVGVTTPTVELLAGKYGMSAEDAKSAQRQMTVRAAQEDLVFRTDGQRSGNTRDAHRLIQFAKARDRQAEMVERLHRAYFTEQLSVFDPSSLIELGVQVGLDREEVVAMLAGEDYGDAVEADEAMARALGVNGVPFFVIDRRYGISGAQPAESIVRVLEEARSAAA